MEAENEHLGIAKDPTMWEMEGRRYPGQEMRLPRPTASRGFQPES